MKCPNCQSENSPGAKFCNECGHLLIPPTESATASALLGENLDRIQKYPPQGLVGKILSPREKIEGELRQVTIMFCDMKGFTPLSASIGPERTFSLMDKIFEIIIRRVNEYEGMVNELRGDGALAFFGAPIAMEEAPIKALHCALAIQMEIAAFNATISDQKDIPPILFRIGINSGPVVVGVVGNDLRAQFTAQGDTVNVAARMEAIAKPGTIYVTEETYKATKPMFRFENLGDIRVKGKERPLRVYRLISAKADTYRPRLGSERFLYSEMVGRDKELARLELQVMKAVNRQGSIVNIVGEAGIGKSRLLAELKKRDVIKWTTLLEGRATSIGRKLSFHPLIDLLRRWAGIIQEDSSTTAAYKLERIIQIICKDDIDEVMPFIATFMGAKLSASYEQRTKDIDGRDLRKLIFKSVRELFSRAAELNTLIVVIEDLHWADASTVDILESIYRLAENKRILFLNLFRPGYSDATVRIAEAIKKFPQHSLEIELKSLDERNSERMVRNMLPSFGPHHPVVVQIARHAGGNPFFIEEVVQSLIDEGAVVQERGTYRVTQKMESFSVPSTVNDILMSRIDHLDENSRKVLKAASVIGRAFFYCLLSDMVGNLGNIDDSLSLLKQKKLLQERIWMGELAYLFYNELTHRVVYETILPEKRKELHRRVARSIEKIFSNQLGEFYGMLAYHYSRAEDVEKTEEYLTKAGEESLRSSASSEALQYYEEALRVYMTKHRDKGDPEKISMLEKNIALSLYNRGQLAESIEYFNNSLSHYWGKFPANLITAIPKITSAILHLFVALYLPVLKFRKMPTQRDMELIDLFHKKCKALGILDPMRFFFEFLYLNKKITRFDITKFQLGLEVFMGASSLFSFSGISFKLSRKILDAARDKFDKNNAILFTSYEWLDTIHNYAKGDWKAISDHDDDLVNNNLRLGRTWDASQHLYWHGLLKIYQGSFKDAKRIVDRLKGIAQEYDNEFSLMLMYELNINMLLESRNLKEALLESEKAIILAQETIFHIYLFDLYSYKTWIHILLQDMAEAEICLQEMRKIRPTTSAVPIELISFYRTEMEFCLCKLEESIQKGEPRLSPDFRKAFKASRRRMARVSKKAAQHRTELCRLTGKYYWLIGKEDKAQVWWRRAIDAGKQLGNRLELSRTYFEIGKSFLESNHNYRMLDGIKAEEYLERARILFEEMDLRWDLAEWRRVAMR